MKSLFKLEDSKYPLIKYWANKYNVPVSLVMAIFALESQFNSDWKRFEEHLNDSSYGIGQILYNTAKGLGYTGSPDGLFDDNTNLKYSVKFIANLYKKYQNIDDTIASYNMGYPRKAKDTTEIIKNIWGTPQSDWIYANQPYVNRIKAYHLFYHYKFEAVDEKTSTDIYNLINSGTTAEKYKKVINYIATVGSDIYSKTGILPVLLLIAVPFLIKSLK